MSKSLKYVSILSVVGFVIYFFFAQSHNIDATKQLEQYSENYVLNNRPVLSGEDYRLFDNCINSSLRKVYAGSEYFMKSDGFMTKTLNQEYLQKTLDRNLSACSKNVEGNKAEGKQIKDFFKTLYN